jgi:hypothetical protein
MALKEISNISDFYAISQKGEVKELLIVSKMESTQQHFNIHCVDIMNKDSIHQYSIKSDLYKQEINTEQAKLNETYFYEAGNTLVKMRCFKHSAKHFELKHIDPKLPYFCSNKLHPEFVGRCFNLKTVFLFSSKAFKNYLSQNAIQQINLKIRGLNFKTNELLQSMKLKEGGNDYFFILPYQGKKMVFHCQKTND